jgi:uncharacterized damage-inducible protein DinB
MKTLFQYNWQVRNDWFSWCEAVSEEELLKTRIGGVGGILKTLFHIVDVEYSWICILQGKPDFEEQFEAYNSLQKVQGLSKRFHSEVEAFIMSWTSEMEDRKLTIPRSNGETITYKHGEINRHVIAHEIHHMGQLSVWARDIGLEPVTANLIRRGLFD